MTGQPCERTGEEVRRCSEQRCPGECAQVSREIRWALKKKKMKNIAVVKDNVSSVKVLLLINGDSLLSLMYEVSSVSVS